MKKTENKKSRATVPLRSVCRNTIFKNFTLILNAPRIYSIWAPDFEAKRIFVSFSFSRSYSNFLVIPRSVLLGGMRNFFWGFQNEWWNSIDNRPSYSHQEWFSSYCPFNLISGYYKFFTSFRAVAFVRRSVLLRGISISAVAHCAEFQ